MGNYENYSGVTPIGSSYPPDQYFYAAYNSYNPNYQVAQQQAAIQQAQQIAAAQQSAGTTQPETVQAANGQALTFQGKPEEKSSSATPWVIGGLTIAAGALALYARHKGGGNIVEGLKTIWQNITNHKVAGEIAEKGSKAVESVTQNSSNVAEKISEQSKNISDATKDIVTSVKNWLQNVKPTEVINTYGGNVSAIKTTNNGYTLKIAT